MSKIDRDHRGNPYLAAIYRAEYGAPLVQETPRAPSGGRRPKLFARKLGAPPLEERTEIITASVVEEPGYQPVIHFDDGLDVIGKIVLEDTLKERLVSTANDSDDKLCIRTGGPGGVHACYIHTAALKEILENDHPNLLKASEPSIGIDFKKIMREMWEKRSPEEKERYLAWKAREKKLNAEGLRLEGVMERLEWVREPEPAPSPTGRRGSMMASKAASQTAQKRSDPPKSRIAESWTVPLIMRIEEKEGMSGERREIIRFVKEETGEGPVTGHEAYTLNEDLCRCLVDPEDLRQRPSFYICAGTPGSWHACHVDPIEIADFLREKRPHLFARLDMEQQEDMQMTL